MTSSTEAEGPQGQLEEVMVRVEALGDGCPARGRVLRCERRDNSTVRQICPPEGIDVLALVSDPVQAIPTRG